MIYCQGNYNTYIIRPLTYYSFSLAVIHSNKTLLITTQL